MVRGLNIHVCWYRLKHLRLDPPCWAANKQRERERESESESESECECECECSKLASLRKLLSSCLFGRLVQPNLSFCHSLSSLSPGVGELRDLVQNLHTSGFAGSPNEQAGGGQPIMKFATVTLSVSAVSNSGRVVSVSVCGPGEGLR